MNAHHPSVSRSRTPCNCLCRAFHTHSLIHSRPSFAFGVPARLRARAQQRTHSLVKPIDHFALFSLHLSQCGCDVDQPHDTFNASQLFWYFSFAFKVSLKIAATVALAVKHRQQQKQHQPCHHIKRASTISLSTSRPNQSTCSD